MSFNVREFIQDFEAMGYVHAEAVQMARLELEKRSSLLVKNAVAYNRRRAEAKEARKAKVVVY